MSTQKKKLTAADIIKGKGKRQILVTTTFDEWTAKAAEEAGFDMILAGNYEANKYMLEDARKGAPNTMLGCGLYPGAYVSQEEALRLANAVRGNGADIVNCSCLALDKWEALAKQHHPCRAHAGYMPVNNTWIGGPRAVGKTAEEAKKVYDECMALEKAGVFALEMECVPARVAAEICKRTKMVIYSMGSGGDLDGQFVFAEDLLGTNFGHYPRHAICYDNLREKAIKAFTQYKEDVVSGAYPAEKHCIKIKDEEFAAFMELIKDHAPIEIPEGPLHKPKKQKLTIADLIALKGRRKFAYTTAFDEFTAKCAEEAGIDVVVSWGRTHEHTNIILDKVRKGAPNTLIGTGINPGAFVSVEEAIRISNDCTAHGAGIMYSSGMAMDKWSALRKQHFPCCGHVGYLPVNDTWYGGPRAVGKTAVEAKKVFDDVMAMEAAGCVAVEMECVPARVAAEISKRTKLLVISMGSGPDCDGQYLFAEDLLGTNNGHYPRHSITYANLYADAVKAFKQFGEDVASKAYPAAKHMIPIKDEEFARFMGMLDEETK